MRNNMEEDVVVPESTVAGIQALRSPADNIVSLSEWLSAQLPWRRRLVSTVRRRIFDAA